jgi:hypothetical protein
LKKGYVLVEGQGEVSAVHNLVSRMSQDMGLSVVWVPPVRWCNIHQTRGLQKGLEFIRRKPDAGALLFLRDEDDACPKEKGPEMAKAISSLCPPCPTAVVLLHPEYEVLFLPCLPRMAGQSLDGRPGLRPDVEWDAPSWEDRRGVKEWLSKRLPLGRSYKPTLDQLPLTRMIDFGLLRDAAVPCFGTLERALAFLDRNFGGAGVYPSPSE